MKINITSSGYTPIQVGKVIRGQDDTNRHGNHTRTETSRTVNIREGNATVGAQYDTITIVGDLRI